MLLVDDEESVQKVLTYPLEREGYRVVQARDGEEALERYREETIDLVILDLMLPRLDGLAVCRRLREERSAVPIIMLTARGDEGDKVLGLELGADDYITKPFSIREFMSRVRALLRRAQLPPPSGRHEVVEVGRNPDRHRPPYGRGARRRTCSSPISSSSSYACWRRAPDAFSREKRCSTSSGAVPTSATRGRSTCTSGTCGRRSRRDPGEPELIFTVRGAGYRFRDAR